MALRNVSNLGTSVYLMFFHKNGMYMNRNGSSPHPAPMHPQTELVLTLVAQTGYDVRPTLLACQSFASNPILVERSCTLALDECSSQLSHLYDAINLAEGMVCHYHIGRMNPELEDYDNQYDEWTLECDRLDWEIGMVTEQMGEAHARLTARSFNLLETSQ